MLLARVQQPVLGLFDHAGSILDTARTHAMLAHRCDRHATATRPPRDRLATAPRSRCATAVRRGRREDLPRVTATCNRHATAGCRRTRRCRHV